MRKIVTFIIFLGLLAIAVAFSAINQQTVTLNYYTGSLSLPLAFIVTAAVILGILIGVSILYFSRLRLLLENRRLSKKLHRLEQEIENLRALPLQELD